jgi:CubicO group peptidase (beta-lactamase class C family)
MIRRPSRMLLDLFLLVVFLYSTPLRAQGVAEDPGVREALHLLDIWIDAQVAYGEIPGAAAAVVHDQELVWAGGYGFANREEGVPVTPSTIFSICSISKLFTSVASDWTTPFGTTSRGFRSRRPTPNMGPPPSRGS